jgi:hypothetical protein
MATPNNAGKVVIITGASSGIASTCEISTGPPFAVESIAQAIAYAISLPTWRSTSS